MTTKQFSERNLFLQMVAWDRKVHTSTSEKAKEKIS
jgi:hypothetical protein